MILYKSAEEIEHMKKAGAILHDVILFAQNKACAGVTTAELDRLIERKILALGGEPGFKKVPGYSWASCICINEEIVHTPPSDKVIQKGDVVTIDTGVYLNGLHTDSAITVQVPPKSSDVTRFLDTGKRALRIALKQAHVGKRIGHISHAFQIEIEGAGYAVVKELTGHGVGRSLHEDPYIPCVLTMDIEKTKLLKVGMTLALEIMYTMGKSHIQYGADGWSIKTADNSMAATFEHSVALTHQGTVVLT